MFVVDVWQFSTGILSWSAVTLTETAAWGSMIISSNEDAFELGDDWTLVVRNHSGHRRELVVQRFEHEPRLS